MLLVTGSGSFERSARWERLQNALASEGLQVFHLRVSGEPTPEIIDQARDQFANSRIEVVVAIGGGSVLDAGKALSAMLPKRSSVVDYLEGVGAEVHDGTKVPFIAVPTTAGAGSEATKNAVIGRVGPQGFKKSLRHDRFIPDVALVDPELTLSCPLEVTAACGMDALVQLLESFVSSAASPLSDVLARKGLELVAECLPRAFRDPGDLEARAGMACAALLSGVCLANAGLGIVHGLASPLGGFFKAPHGAICGSLLLPATRVNLRRIATIEGADGPIARKYAEAGCILSGTPSASTAQGCGILLGRLESWTRNLGMPLLSEFGMIREDIPRVVKQAGCKNNPVPLSPEEIAEILESRLAP